MLQKMFFFQEKIIRNFLMYYLNQFILMNSTLASFHKLIHF